MVRRSGLAGSGLAGSGGGYVPPPGGYFIATGADAWDPDACTAFAPDGAPLDLGLARIGGP